MRPMWPMSKLTRSAVGATGRAVLAALVLVLCAAGWAQAQSDAVAIRFLPQWQPQAQFAGYYMAAQKGLYGQRGLDVTIVQGGPDAPPSMLMETGQVDVATMFLASGIRLAARGVEVVNIAQLIHDSTLLLVAKRSQGVNQLSDLQGRKVGLWEQDFEAQAQALFQANGLQVHVVPQTGTVNLFLADGVAACSAMRYNEYHLILNSGLNPDELAVFPFQGTPFGLPEDGIYCSRAFWQAHPDAATAFVEASLEGWRYAFAHPDETLDLILTKAHAAGVVTNRAHQRWMLERMREVIMPDGSDGLGSISTVLPESEFLRAGALLREAGMINDLPSYDDFCQGPARAH